MAYSYIRYTGDGSTRNYTFNFPYLDSAHIKVRLNGVLTTLFTFLNASTIQLNAAPAGGVIIEIRRETPKDNPIVNFTDGSVLLERDLDLLVAYDFYLAQETADVANSVISQDSLGVWQAQDKRIANVADPTSPQDAVTKNYFESVYTPQLDAKVAASAGSATSAAGSATAAAGSASSAASSAATATSKANDASASATSAGASATFVAANKTNIDAVANNITNVNTVAADKANIDTVAANQAAIHAVGNDLVGSPMVVDYGDLSAATNPASPAGAIGAVYSNLTAIQNASANAATATAQAGVATTKAGEASASATTATAQAAIATTKAGEASSSATSAQTNANNVSALLASFRSVLLGSFTSDANAVAFATANSIAITDGIMYENSVSDKFRIYNGTAWQDYDSSAQASQSAASLSAGNAAVSETNAAGSASAAASSASTASTQAAIATTKASESSASAASALASLNNFKGQYYGALAANPTLDPLGNAVGVGDLYLNTTIPEMRVFDGTNWVAAYVSLAGALLKANNLSDLQNVTTARSNLGLGALAVKSTVVTTDVTDNAITVAKLAATLDLGAI